jgi:hypothetical protein
MEIVPYEKKRGDTKDHPLSQWFSNFSEADELLKLAAARQQVRIVLVFSDVHICNVLGILLEHILTFHVHSCLHFESVNIDLMR